MRSKVVRIVMLACFILFSSNFIFSKTKKNDEKRFQLGFGVLVSTNNIAGMIENVKMMQAINKNKPYDYPNMSPEEKESFLNLNNNLQRGIIIANILGDMEFGIQFRVLYHVLIMESDLLLLPYNSQSDGRFDFIWQINAGIRAPYWIMPYLTAGVTFTFSIYPEEVANVENWKSNWGAIGVFVWRPGINVKAGLDFKFKHFSIGAYYQYTISDFNEFNNFHYLLSKEASKYAAALIFGYQSRFGISLCWYVF